jgi:hypothetical protein
MSPLPLSPPPLTTALIDPNGRVHPLWSRFFINLPTLTNTDLAPATAPFLTVTANASLPNATNLGALTTGFLFITVSGGVATPSTTSSGANLTNLNASNLTSGTVPDARFPATLPALSGVNLTALNGSNVTSGLIALARGGTNADLSATGGTSQVLKQTSSGAAVSVGQLASTDLSDVVSGTYTPTLTNVTNLDASTAYSAQYARVGTVVGVSGRVDVDPTAAGATELGLSIPIASNFANQHECAGTGSSPGIAGQTIAIRADTANDRAALVWTAVDTTNQAVFWTFLYRVI